jgi:tetratricopeptide (TPR) repeat protein
VLLRWCCEACGQPPTCGQGGGNAGRFPRLVHRGPRLRGQAGIGAADCPQIHCASSAWRQAANAVAVVDWLRYGLSAVLSDQGKAEEAIAEYRTAIALDPKSADANYEIGVLLRDRATPNIPLAMRYAMLTEACEHFVTGAQIASSDKDYSSAMRSIERRLPKGKHCPPR